jgi:hypothetical protein
VPRKPARFGVFDGSSKRSEQAGAGPLGLSAWSLTDHFPATGTMLATANRRTAGAIGAPRATIPARADRPTEANP